MRVRALPLLATYSASLGPAWVCHGFGEVSGRFGAGVESRFKIGTDAACPVCTVDGPTAVFEAIGAGSNWTGRLRCRWIIPAVACDGFCNGRGECKCWDLHRWRSVIIRKDSAGAESWMRLKGRSRRKEVQERCITQSPKVDAYVADIARGKISV